MFLSISSAVNFNASAANSLWSQLLHNIDEQDSGDITEYHVFSSIKILSPTPIPKAPPEAPSRNLENQDAKPVYIFEDIFKVVEEIGQGSFAHALKVKLKSSKYTIEDNLIREKRQMNANSKSEPE